MNNRKLDNELTETIVSALHYFDNYQQIQRFESAKEVSMLFEGGIHRYRNDALFHSKVEMLKSRVMKVIQDNN